MSTLWMQTSEPPKWQAVDCGEIVDRFPDLPFQLVGIACDGRYETALLATDRQAIVINGESIIGGLRILQHRDEILVGRRRMYFSFESTPIVTVYAPPSDEPRVRCPVCRSALERGQVVVSCPGCRRMYHHAVTAGPDDTAPAPTAVPRSAGPAASKACWTYYETCKFCGHGTSLTGGNAWRPEEEGDA